MYMSQEIYRHKEVGFDPPVSVSISQFDLSFLNST